MNKTTHILGGIFLLAISGCGKTSGGISASGTANPDFSEQSDDSIPESPLAGVVDAKEWKVGQGWVEIRDGKLNITLGDTKSSQPCSKPLGAERFIDVTAPEALGETRIPSGGNELKAYISIQKAGIISVLIGQRARFVISQITSTEIVGSMALEVDANNRVRGQFRLLRCKNGNLIEPTPEPQPNPQPTPVTNPPPAPGEGERTLGMFKLQTARGMGGSNQMNIEEPKAKRVFADFSYSPTQSTTIGFHRGTSSGFNCSLNMRRSFILMTLDETGNVVESKNHPGFPESLVFEAGKHYLLRHVVEGFSDFCDYLNVGFLAATR